VRRKRTSQTDPIQVAFLDEHRLPLDGRIGVTFVPGQKQAHAQSGSQERNRGRNGIGTLSNFGLFRCD